MKVPLIIRAPGISSGKSKAFAELVDLYPTLLDLSGIEKTQELQGKSLVPILKGQKDSVRDFAFSVTQGGDTYLIRTDRWAFIQYGKEGESGMELFDMYQDPGQFTNLAHLVSFQDVVKEMQSLLTQKLAEVQQNDLGKTY